MCVFVCVCVCVCGCVFKCEHAQVYSIAQSWSRKFPAANKGQICWPRMRVQCTVLSDLRQACRSRGRRSSLATTDRTNASLANGIKHVVTERQRKASRITPCTHTKCTAEAPHQCLGCRICSSAENVEVGFHWPACTVSSSITTTTGYASAHTDVLN